MSLPEILTQLQAGTFESSEEKFDAMRGAGRPGDGRYFLEDPDGFRKERVPAVTTVNDCMHPRGLFHWHYENGAAGRMFGDGGTPALEVGSVVHRMVENRIHGLPVTEPAEEIAPLVMSAYGAFERWWHAGKFKVVATEVPLVSRKYRVGGTPDAILLDGEGRVCLGDWKSSNGLYANYLRQIAIYGAMWDEQAPERFQLTGGFHLVRFAKTNGDMEHRHFPELEDALESFVLLRRMYDLNKSLEKRIR
jgi:hypothetical protein